MQFKRQGLRIQVLAYRGYDKEKRRAVVKLLGSMDADTFEASPGLLGNLQGNELEELQAYVEENRQKRDRDRRLRRARELDLSLRIAAEAIGEGEFVPDGTWAADTWAAIDALTKAMRKAGHKRPQKAAQEPAEAPWMYKLPLEP